MGEKLPLGPVGNPSVDATLLQNGELYDLWFDGKPVAQNMPAEELHALAVGILAYTLPLFTGQDDVFTVKQLRMLRACVGYVAERRRSDSAPLPQFRPEELAELSRFIGQPGSPSN